jgi:branched-chain amino acid transport system ATP-binding protein
VVTELLRELKGEHTIVLIEHDMEAVFALADRISVLVYGKRSSHRRARGGARRPEVRGLSRRRGGD